MILELIFVLFFLNYKSKYKDWNFSVYMLLILKFCKFFLINKLCDFFCVVLYELWKEN